MAMNDQQSVQSVIQEAEPAYRRGEVEAIVYEMAHQNGEKTILSAVPYSNGYVLSVADLDKSGNVMKQKEIGTASSKQAAEKGLGWWVEENPKGLEYGTIESIKMAFGSFT